MKIQSFYFQIDIMKLLWHIDLIFSKRHRLFKMIISHVYPIIAGMIKSNWLYIWIERKTDGVNQSMINTVYNYREVHMG